MVDQNPKRSNEPVVWGLFGAGGTFGAIFAPVVIVLLCFVMPFASDHLASNIWNLAFGNILGKLFMFLLIVLPAWCSLHRLHHISHDLKMHIPAGRLMFYGLAGLITLLAFYGLFL